MAVGFETKQYILGRGKLYFDAFVPDTETPTGERYLGNTPSITMTTAYNNLDHYSADEGLSLLDDSVTLRTDRAGNFTLDNINMRNVAMFWGQPEPDAVTVSAATAVTETLSNVKLGHYYQLGVDTDTPAGVGKVANVAVDDGGAVTATGNYTVDLTHGRIYILPDAADIADGDDLDLTYDTILETRDFVVENPEQIEGALRFIADNPKGPDYDHFWPRVKIQPSGDFALKGDTWQTMTMAFQVLTPSDGRGRVYVNGRRAS